MKYLIVKSFKGSPDGRFAVEYNAGETVELSDSLARVALGEEWVRLSEADKPEAAPEEKKKTKGGGKASVRSLDSEK